MEQKVNISGKKGVRTISGKERAERKQQVLKLYKEGLPPKAIAYKMGRSTSLIYSIIAELKEEGKIVVNEKPFENTKVRDAVIMYMLSRRYTDREIGKFLDVSFNTIQNVKNRKETLTDEEINKIRIACEITDNCFTLLLSYIKTGMTEKQIALEIEMYFKTHGADGVSFDPIVAIGENSSIPHWIPGDRKVEMADPILIDMGCKYEGYCSDMTRTIFMGCILEEIKPVYDLALKNLELSTKEITDGYTIKTAANMVESDFKVNGYNLIHALGHGVGLEVHELPFIRLKNEANFKENMVIADEPGIYLPGKYGIRIEDTLLVTKDGSERLTKSERGYVVI